jgi:hypothetical protein
MLKISRLILACICLICFSGSVRIAEDNTPIDPLAYVLPENKDEVFEISWEDLLPPGEDEKLAEMYQQQMMAIMAGVPVAEGSANDVAVQFGTHNTVDILDGHKIRIPGYTVPFEFGPNAKVKEFLLVPYFGACLHAPPPPPNQTIYVTTQKPFKVTDLAQAVWIEGYVRTESAYNELGDAAYTIKMTKIEEYDF